MGGGIENTEGPRVRGEGSNEEGGDWLATAVVVDGCRGERERGRWRVEANLRWCGRRMGRFPAVGAVPDGEVGRRRRLGGESRRLGEARVCKRGKGGRR